MIHSRVKWNQQTPVLCITNMTNSRDVYSSFFNPGKPYREVMLIMSEQDHRTVNLLDDLQNVCTAAQIIPHWVSCNSQIASNEHKSSQSDYSVRAVYLYSTSRGALFSNFNLRKYNRSWSTLNLLYNNLAFYRLFKAAPIKFFINK